jgi:two-component sensor histidine kinase
MRSSLLFSIFFFLMHIVLVAQNNRADLESTTTAIEAMQDDTAKVRQLYHLSKAFRRSDSEKRVIYLEKALSLAKQTKAVHLMPIIYGDLAVANVNQKKLELGLQYLQQQEQGYLQQDSTQKMIGVYKKLLYVLKRLGKYEAATAAAFQGLQIAQELGDKREEGSMNGKLGSLFYTLEDYEKGGQYAEKAYQIAKSINHESDRIYAVRLLGDLKTMQEDYAAALAYQQEALAYYREKQSTIQLSAALTSVGETLYRMERFTEAEEALQEALTNEGTDQYYAYHPLARTYVAQGKYQQALAPMRAALEQHRSINNRFAMQKSYDELTQIYSALGQYDSAFHYSQLDQALSDSLLNAQTNERMAELETQYETAQKEAKIELQATQLRQQRQFLWGIGAFLLLAIGGGGLLWSLNRRLQQRNAEKELLIKEVHHRVKNNLQVLSSLLYLQSRHIQDETALDAVREGQNRVESMSLIHQKLYTTDTLTTVDMQDYLRNLGDNLLDSFGILDDRITVLYEVAPLQLDVDTAIPMGLISNELLTNTLKYAFKPNQSGQVWIRLREKGQQLVLEIADTGNGSAAVTPGKQGTSFGSSLIDMLSKKLKGKITVSDTTEGYSTTIAFPASLTGK